MQLAYIVIVNGKQIAVAQSLEEAKRVAEQHRADNAELKISSKELEPAPRASPTLTRTWSYDYGAGVWVAR